MSFFNLPKVKKNPQLSMSSPLLCAKKLWTTWLMHLRWDLFPDIYNSCFNYWFPVFYLCPPIAEEISNLKVMPMCHFHKMEMNLFLVLVRDSQGAVPNDHFFNYRRACYCALANSRVVRQSLTQPSDTTPTPAGQGAAPIPSHVSLP